MNNIEDIKNLYNENGQNPPEGYELEPFSEYELTHMQGIPKYIKIDKRKGRKKIYSTEEIKQHKADYDIKYQKNRYNTDPIFKQAQIDRQKRIYEQKQALKRQQKQDKADADLRERYNKIVLEKAIIV